MVSVDLYERDVNTIVEDAIMCGKSGSAISSVPPLHATPAAFISHSNNRNSAVQLRRSMAKVNPTYVMGGCGGSLQPDAAFKESLMEGGSRSSQWTFLYQGKDGATAENFYDCKLALTLMIRLRNISPF
jgi:alkaline phosphatase